MQLSGMSHQRLFFDFLILILLLYASEDISMSPIDVIKIVLLLICTATLFGLTLLCTRHFISNLLPEIQETQKLVQTVCAAQIRKPHQSKHEDSSKFQTKPSIENKIPEDKICENPASNLPIDLAP